MHAASAAVRLFLSLRARWPASAELTASTIQTRSSRKARVCFTLLCGSYCCASGRAPYRATNRPSAPPKLHWLVTSHRQRQEHRFGQQGWGFSELSLTGHRRLVLHRPCHRQAKRAVAIEGPRCGRLIFSSSSGSRATLIGTAPCCF
jgi:hypothetical protein